MKNKKGKKFIKQESNKFQIESRDLNSILNIIKDQISDNNKEEVTIVANINIGNNNSSELESNNYKPIDLSEKDLDSIIDYIINHLQTFNSKQIRKLQQGLFLWGNTQKKLNLKKLVQENINLSKREKEILIEICNGLNNSQIAKKKFISRRTVDTHRTNLLSKTNCRNTAQLVVWAIKNNLYDLP